MNETATVTSCCQLEKIELTSYQKTLLARLFNVPEEFIQKAADLTELPVLSVESNASNAEEASHEFWEADCCSDQRKAAARKWVEFCFSTDVLAKIFDSLCKEPKVAEFEKMLCIRKRAAFPL